MRLAVRRERQKTAACGKRKGFNYEKNCYSGVYGIDRDTDA